MLSLVIQTKLAQLLRLDRHPDWLAAGRNAIHQLRVLDSIVYRCDIASRFLSQKRARQSHAQSMREEALQAASMLGCQHRKNAKKHETLEMLLSKLVLDHFRVALVSGLAPPSTINLAC